MGPAMNDFLHQAMATGQALPEAMRPMVDQFIESGQLIDENGDAFKSAEDAGITFSETLDQQFAKLIDRLNEFIDALMGVGSAHIPPINVPIQFNGEGEFETGHGIRFEPFAKGGVVTRPTLGLVGERGPEVIQPLDEVRKDRQRTIAEMRALMKEVRNAGTGGPVSVFIGGEKLDGVLNRRKRAGMLE
jgi:phage-related minor tail protein